MNLFENSRLGSQNLDLLRGSNRSYYDQENSKDFVNIKMPKKPTEGAAGGPSGGLLGKDDDLRTKIRFLEDEIIKLKKNYQEKLADQPLDMNVENIGSLRKELNLLATQIQQKSESLLELRKWNRENELKKEKKILK